MMLKPQNLRPVSSFLRLKCSGLGWGKDDYFCDGHVTHCAKDSMAQEGHDEHAVESRNATCYTSYFWYWPAIGTACVRGEEEGNTRCFS